ncbi:MAG: cyclase [Thermoleophilia bacterium]|nr:cyclase [Thermoleophilia bacterium]
MAAVTTFLVASVIQAPAEAVFAWHLRDGAFEDLVPPWDGTRVEERSGRLEDNSMRVVLSVPVLGPIRQRWTIRHEGFVAGRSFTDVMERGPFPKWRHTHLVTPVDADTCRLTDSIDYELPLGRLGELGGARMVRRRLEKTFEYRHRVTHEAFEA